MTFGSGLTLLIRRLNLFQKLEGRTDGLSSGLSSTRRSTVEGGSQVEYIRFKTSLPQPTAPLPSHWIMSSSFSTLAKVATLFLSK